MRQGEDAVPRPSREAGVNASQMREQLRAFVCSELLRKPDYPLADDEPLITGGLIDSFALAQVGVFVEVAFGVYLEDIDLTVVNMDTIDRMTHCIVKARP